jgi:hypothetical protein
VGKWNGKYRTGLLDAGAQADLLLIFNRATDGSAKPQPYFEMPELFAGTSPEAAPVSLHLGRKLVHWSRLDESWELGIWQPRYRWDYLHPEIVGMTGAFLSVNTRYFQAVGFASPLFVPERGVPIQTRDGTFASDSRWFIPPPSMIQLYGEDTPVHYNLARPDLSSILIQDDLARNFSLMVRGGAESGPWASAAYARKPMNQLLLASNGYLRTSDSRPIFADATIYPHLAYHELASVEGGYSAERVDTWVSLLREWPRPEPTPAEWTVQQVLPATSASASADIRVAGTQERPLSMDLSYLRRWGGNSGDMGPQASGNGASSFEARYPFQSAWALGVKSRPVNMLSGSTRLTYDIGHRGALWSTEVRIHPRESWMLGLGADILSVPETQDVDGSNLIGRFRANDRVHAGVTYVF